MAPIDGTVPELDAPGEAWLRSLTAEIEALTPEERRTERLRAETMERAIAAIEAGTPPLCAPQA